MGVFFFLPQVKGYRYLEEDDSDESDEEESEGEKTDDDDDEPHFQPEVVEEMEAGDEEGAQDARPDEVDSPRARRRGVEGQQHRWEEEEE